MLRLRKDDGAVLEVTQSTFVEVADDHGDIAYLIYTTPSGVVKLINANDPEAERYSHLFHVKFCPVIKI